MNTPTLQTPNYLFLSPVKCFTLFSHNYNLTSKRHSYSSPHRIIFPPKKYWRCEAAKSPPPPRQPRSKKPDPDYEKGVNPVGFLAKFNISDKPFAQFLRERFFILCTNILKYVGVVLYVCFFFYFFNDFIFVL